MVCCGLWLHADSNHGLARARLAIQRRHVDKRRPYVISTRSASNHLHQLRRRRYVLDDLAGFGADAEVAEVGENRGQFVGVGDLDQTADHRGGVELGVLREIGEVADAGDILGPAGMLGINGPQCFADGLVARDVGMALAGDGVMS